MSSQPSRKLSSARMALKTAQIRLNLNDRLFAKLLAYDPRTLKHKQSIDTELARRLGGPCGVRPGTWLNLANGTTARDASPYGDCGFEYMLENIKRGSGWIPGCNEALDRLAEAQALMRSARTRRENVTALQHRGAALESLGYLHEAIHDQTEALRQGCGTVGQELQVRASQADILQQHGDHDGAYGRVHVFKKRAAKLLADGLPSDETDQARVRVAHAFIKMVEGFAILTSAIVDNSSGLGEVQHAYALLQQSREEHLVLAQLYQDRPWYAAIAEACGFGMQAARMVMEPCCAGDAREELLASLPWKNLIKLADAQSDLLDQRDTVTMYHRRRARARQGAKTRDRHAGELRAARRRLQDLICRHNHLLDPNRLEAYGRACVLGVQLVRRYVRDSSVQREIDGAFFETLRAISRLSGKSWLLSHYFDLGLFQDSNRFSDRVSGLRFDIDKHDVPLLLHLADACPERIGMVRHVLTNSTLLRAAG